MILALVMVLTSLNSGAQVVDGVLGQPRSVVQVLLRPYRIIDYQKDRQVHNILPGIHQTVLYENDTCRKFYWAVTPANQENFDGLLKEAGYRSESSGVFVKDSLNLNAKPLESGKAVLYIASLSGNLKGNRQPSGARIPVKRVSSLEDPPLLQQAVMAAEKDTTAKAPKDPQRHWIGSKYSRTSILGWD